MGRLVALLLAIAAAGAACGGGSDTASTNGRQATGPVRDIENVLALRSAFNSDRGKPRLLLILSPT